LARRASGDPRRLALGTSLLPLAPGEILLSALNFVRTSGDNSSVSGGVAACILDQHFIAGIIHQEP